MIWLINFTVIFGILISSQFVRAQTEGTAFINGKWFNGKDFQSSDFYVVDNSLTKERPQKILSTIDLKEKYVIPPFGDAHQHNFNTRQGIEKDIENFLQDGIFYVMVQDSLGEVSADLVSRVNTPESVDVVYTTAPLIGPGSGLIDYFKSLNESGHFSKKLSAEELNSKAFFLLENKAELNHRWSKISAMNPDFVKVILAFSEEDEKRRNDKRFYDDPNFQMARPGVPPKLLPEIVRLAHQDGKRVSVHIETANDFHLAVRAGADIIAHLPGWHVGPTAGFEDESLNHWLIKEDDARLAAENKVSVITTTYPKPFFDNEKLAEDFKKVHLANLSLLKKHKVKIITGSDNDEARVSGELEHLKNFGVFDNLELLKMSVETTPRMIFPKRKIGYLREGYEASFLVLEKNPLENLETLQSIVMSVKQGLIIKKLEDEADIKFTAVPITKNIYLIQIPEQPASDNIIAFIGKEGILLVDNGYPETEKALRDTLRSLSPLPIKFMINTHFHHAGANAAFAREAMIIAHKNVRSRMQHKIKMYGQFPIGPWEEFALPKITFDEEMTIYFEDEEIQIVHFPNVHTDGDAVVFFKNSNVVATGDFFVPLLGVCDLANGCQWSKFQEGIKTLLNIIPKDAKIAPGHFKLSSYKDLQEVDEMLTEVTELVREQIKAGKTLEEIKAKSIPERWRYLEKGGINADFFLTNVYEGVKLSR